MNIQQRKEALILTHRIVPGHQIACMLQMHGWSAISQHESMTLDTVYTIHPHMLVLDLTDPKQRNIALLDAYRRFDALTYIVGLCRGGNSPAMRAARDMGIDGFFYLNQSGLSIDTSIGLAPLLLSGQHPEARRKNMPRFFANPTLNPNSVYPNS